MRVSPSRFLFPLVSVRSFFFYLFATDRTIKRTLVPTYISLVFVFDIMKVFIWFHPPSPSRSGADDATFRYRISIRFAPSKQIAISSFLPSRSRRIRTHRNVDSCKPGFRCVFGLIRRFHSCIQCSTEKSYV